MRILQKLLKMLHVEINLNKIGLVFLGFSPTGFEFLIMQIALCHGPWGNFNENNQKLPCASRWLEEATLSQCAVAKLVFKSCGQYDQLHFKTSKLPDSKTCLNCSKLPPGTQKHSNSPRQT